MANNPNRGFNTVSESNVSRRDQRIRLQRMTFIAVVAIAALMVVALLVLMIGAIASGNSDNPASNNSANWTTTPVSVQDTVAGDLVIVNGTHQYTFPADLSHMTKVYEVSSAHSASYKQGDVEYMETNALKAVDQMLTDMAAATGYTQATLASGYRSYDDQEAIGSATKGGFSDHHTGRLCAINNTNDAAKTWLANNAHKYGFVMRYPDAKADITGVSGYDSAYRYVGIPHAMYMHNNNLCLEEYVDYLKTHNTDSKPLTVTGADGKAYRVSYYTVSGSATVKIPTKLPYTISGTNEGGVIVTICMVPAETEAATGADANP